MLSDHVAFAYSVNYSLVIFDIFRGFTNYQSM